MSDKEETDDTNVAQGVVAEKDVNLEEIIDHSSFSNFYEEIIEKEEEDDSIETVDEKSEKEEIVVVDKKTFSNLFRRDLSKFHISSIYQFIYFYVMKQHFAEFCLSFGLLLTVLSSLFHSHYAMKTRLMQRKAPSPVRFFPRNSLVTDYYDGNELDLHKLLSMQTNRDGSAGILFVMYYAPWCARSMDAKWHMDSLARYFYPNLDNFNSSATTTKIAYGPVHFVAVNCWNPNGQCQRTHKLYTYPVFLAYPGTVNGIYYNGIISADYMFRFLENLISPFVRLQNDDEITDFLHDYRTGAIGYFDFKTYPKPRGYQQFYLTALKSLERDPLRAATKFGIITQTDLGSRWNFDRNSQIKLYRHMDETILDYPLNREYVAKSISSWVFENLANPVRWISPSSAGAGKSDALHEFITRRPTLILFAPRQPLFEWSPYYTMLTNVALQYFDCVNKTEDWDSTIYRSVDEILKKLYERQDESKLNKRRLDDFCLRKLREETRLLNDCCGDIVTTIGDGQKVLYDYRQRNICHVCYPQNSQKSSPAKMVVNFLSKSSSASRCERFFNSDDLPNTMTSATKEFLTPIFSSRSCDRLINDFLPKASVIDYCCQTDEKENKSGEKIRRRLIDRRKHSTPKLLPHAIDDIKIGERSIRISNCERLRLSRLLRYYYGEEGLCTKKEIGEKNLEWQGLACRTNNTLQFAAMDGNFYGAFARKLGLNGTKESPPTAVIFDNAKEAIYTLDGPLSVNRLGEFVVNFTNSRLFRFYRTENLQQKSWRNEFYTPSTSMGDTCVSESVCIRAVSSSTFRSVVMDRSKDVLLFYTARWCGACQRLFYIYQTLAYYFRVVGNDIIFAQMDVTSNDLPWHFTIDNVPALIFFPAGKKSESVVFSSYAPWTLPNLVAFVIAHCQRETRLRFALSTCVRNSTDENTTPDNRCLIRNRYRTWRQLSKIERKLQFTRLEIDRLIQISKWDWDHEDNDEWRVYLQRSWIDVWKLEMKKRALRTLLNDALKRNHFDLGN